MAKIVLGIGTSHGPLLSTPPDMWHLRAEWDRSQIHPYLGRDYTYDELRDVRRGENFVTQITPEERRRRFDACQVAIERLAQVWVAAKPDVAVIFGNDQMEIFGNSLMPAFFVYAGEGIENGPASEERKAKMEPSIAVALDGHKPKQRVVYPGLPALAKIVVARLIAEEFDISVSDKLPTGPRGSADAPHAFGFVYERIMKGKVVPNLPLFTNTFYPPNQPSAKRCYRFGEAVAEAIASWDSDLRVAVFGSGGLSHFAINEALDREVMAAVEIGDKGKLAALPQELLQEGTSEIKNWIPLAAVMAQTKLAPNFVDYVPCYRSEAGTGHGMAFMYWQ
jgi:Catalytic LigB subunit of aromatic ring-opening dioxygenase